MAHKSLYKLNERIIRCTRCPRLSSYIHKVAKEKTRRYEDEKYWGRPLTGFGDIKAKILIVGLAPAAHGGNRTGRMFTGDSSGDWLARALYENGFATMPTSRDVNDGFKLINTYITASVRCAPPQNKPLKEELDNCAAFLNDELNILQKINVIVCLGRIAFDSIRKLLDIQDEKFFHGNLFKHGKLTIVCTYHPSRQNTQTGRLTWSQWSCIFNRVREILKEK